MPRLIYNTTSLPNTNSIHWRLAASTYSILNPLGTITSYNITNQMTFSCWVRMDVLPTATRAIATNESAATFTPTEGWEMHLAIAAPRFGFSIGNGANRIATSAAAAAINTWYHIVGTYNGAIVQIWVNGVLGSISTSTTGNITSTAANNRLKIGAMGGATQSNCADQCYIDEVTYWNVGMNVQNVLELYNNGRPKRPTLHSKAANLQLWFRMGDSPYDIFPNIRNMAPLNSKMGPGVMTLFAATDIAPVVPWRG